MEKLRKNKYYIAFICSLCVFFSAIILLHSYYNLKTILQAPSDTWGRSTTLEAKDLFRKQPSIRISDEHADILVANKSDFTHVQINRATRLVESKPIAIDDVETFKVQKFEWDENNIYFIESNGLFLSAKDTTGEYHKKTKISDDVLDFDILYTKDGVMIVAAQKDGVKIYRQVGNLFEENVELFQAENLKGVSAVQDNAGILHIAAYGESSEGVYPVYYITLQNNRFDLAGSAIEKTTGQSWSMSDIELGIDDKDAYIFYEMTKRDKFGVGAKVHYSCVPLNIEIKDMKFERFFLTEEDAGNLNSYVSDITAIKSQEEAVKLTVVKDTVDVDNKEGFAGYYVTMDGNKIASITRITGTESLVVDTDAVEYKGDTAFVHLNAAGGFNYEAFFTESGRSYYINSLQPTQEDYKVALAKTVPGYVSSLMVSLIKFIIYLPVIIWFLIIEFFEIKRLKDKKRLSFSIGLVLYLIIKVLTFNTYYTPLSISQMPPLLLFTGAKYIFAIGMALVSLLIQKLMKKHNPEMGLITEFIIFALIDIEFTNLLFATYMTA